MSEIVDAKGLPCPQPVVLTRKSLEKNDEITVIVDNKNSFENIKRLGIKEGCQISYQEKENGVIEIYLKKIKKETSLETQCKIEGVSPTVFAITSDKMGRGEDELGSILIRAFFHTLAEHKVHPHTIIFYNSGVKLTVKDSPVLEDIKKLEEKGVKILICGTCTNYFGITNEVAVGTISNMYDIVDVMMSNPTYINC